MMGRFVAIWMVLSMALAGMAWRAWGEEQPKGRFANVARDMRDRANWIRQRFFQLAADLGRYEDFVKADLPAASAAYEAAAVLCEKSADAFDRDDEPEGRRIQAESEKAEQIADVWRQRLWDCRRLQAEAAPSEDWFRDQTRWTLPGALPDLYELVQARKTAAKAWCELAEATVPGADPKVLAELQEKAHEADALRQIAEWKTDWARHREGLWDDRKIDSQAMRHWMAQMEKLQEERRKIRQADIARDRRIRDIDRQMRQAESEFRKAHQAARERK